jgi:uncharacterized protein YaaR (DUF327 family)
MNRKSLKTHCCIFASIAVCIELCYCAKVYSQFNANEEFKNGKGKRLRIAEMSYEGGQAMRIQDSSSLRELDKNTKSSSPVKKIINSFFLDELNQQEEEVASHQSSIDALRAEIEEAGTLLSTDPTLPNFKRFRDLLSTLAKRVNAEAYRLEKFGGTPQNPRYFEIITVINREADNLYNLIVKENCDSMAITAKVIGIKGLVVDLVT